MDFWSTEKPSSTKYALFKIFQEFKLLEKKYLEKSKGFTILSTFNLG